MKSEEKKADSGSRSRAALRQATKVLASVPRAFGLVGKASPGITVLLFAETLASSFIPVTLLWMTKLVVDSITTLAGPGRSVPDMPPLFRLIGILGVLWVVQSGLSALHGALANMLQFRVEQHTQTLIMRKGGTLDVSFYENPKNLDVLDKATQGAMMSAWTLIQLLFAILQTGITLASYLTVLARLHWVAVLVIATTTLPQMATSAFFARRRWKLNWDLAEESRLRYWIAWLTGQKDPAKEIRVFGLLETLLRRFLFFSRKFYDKETAITRKQGAADFLLGTLSTAGAVGIWVHIATRAAHGSISLGDVVLYTSIVANSRSLLLALFSQGGRFYEQTLFLGNLFGFLDLDPSSVAGALSLPGDGRKRCGTAPAPDRLGQGIEFRGVSFRYPEAPADSLHDLSFLLKPGQSVALVGKNGAGKTTLAKLLVRLYDPSEGQILLDGRDLREYDLDGLRRLFGVIFQDYIRYPLTARENIGFGCVDRLDDMGAIRSAARKAGVEEMVEKLPSRYETYLDRRFGNLSTDLSGGEWQKIALARAYMRDSEILVLDEPTASLDAFAEYEVYKSFDEMTEGRLSIYISHRFSTVRMARNILVLDGGRLVQKGTHEELMRQGGLYKEMFETQADRYRV